MTPIAFISQSVIHTLNLDIVPGTPVFIGETNIEHIKTRHPYEYEKYFSDIGTIISTPDYVGLNPKDSSILFVKLYEIDGEYVRTALLLCQNIVFIEHLQCGTIYQKRNLKNP